METKLNPRPVRMVASHNAQTAVMERVLERVPFVYATPLTELVEEIHTQPIPRVRRMSGRDIFAAWSKAHDGARYVTSPGRHRPLSVRRVWSVARELWATSVSMGHAMGGVSR